MPIVTLELVADAEAVLEPNMAQRLADAVGRVFNSPSGQTWIRVHRLPRHLYAENESALDPAELPVFVTITKRQPPRGSALETEVAALTLAIAQVTGRPPTCVHIEYAPAAAGRIAFGGKIVQ